MNDPKIIYPATFEPSANPVFVRNEIDIQASPERIWFWLTYVISWSDWYNNASKVRIINQRNNHLKAGTIFHWKTFGVHLRSEVMEFVPYHRLAWVAKGFGVRAYHAWLIVLKEDGCKIITEETQRGWICRIGKLLLPHRMYKYHQLWLEGLKRKAEKG